MEPFRNQMTVLQQLLEEMITHYHLLIRDLKKESETLKQVSIEPLIRLGSSIEDSGQEILKRKAEVQKTIGSILISLGREPADKTLNDLLPIVPGPYYQKLRDYRRNLQEAQAEVERLNGLNKTFIQSSLEYLDEIFSLIFSSTAPSVYLQTGYRRVVPSDPVGLSRRI